LDFSDVHGQHSMLPQGPSGIAVRNHRIRAYEETAFRYLLTIERERCRRSGRPFLLLLVDVEAPSGVSVPWDPRLARKLFWSLSRCLRETDFSGWYLDQRVAGAVLTELGDELRADVTDVVAARVGGALRAALPPSMTGRLRVRLSLNPEPLSGGLACSS